MHIDALNFVSILSRVFPNHFVSRDILEVGSYIVNDSVRQFFIDCNYTGLDLAAGPGVDVVESGHSYSPGRFFDVVLSCECLEHDSHYKETFHNMLELTKPGGLCAFTCATTGRDEHGTCVAKPEQSPGTQSKGSNYYRNIVSSDLDLALVDKHFAAHCFIEDNNAHDLYFVGVKNLANGVDELALDAIDRVKKATARSAQALSLTRSLPDQSTAEQKDTLRQVLILLDYDPLPMLFEAVFNTLRKHTDIAEAWLSALEDKASSRAESRQQKLIRARLHWDIGNNALAITLYRALHSEDPDDWHVSTLLANALRLEGETEQALAVIRKTVYTEPAEPWPYREYIHCVTDVEEKTELVQVLSKVFDRGVGHNTLYFSSARLAFEVGAFLEAERWFRLALISGFGDRRAVWTYLSKIYSQTEQTDMAIYAQREAHAIDHV